MDNKRNRTEYMREYPYKYVDFDHIVIRGTASFHIKYYKFNQYNFYRNLFTTFYKMEYVGRSVYDVLEENLKIAGRKTYLHRYMYIGENTFCHHEKNFETAMGEIINEINTGYCDEPLTGCLLMYPNYFIQVLDGSEETLLDHLKLLYDRYGSIIGRTKLLAGYHHINQRFFNTWTVRTGKPPTLLEKFNPASDVKETARYNDMCISKMYTLLLVLRELESDSSTESLDYVCTRIPESCTQYLPEYSLLDFLLNSKYIQDTKNYIEHYSSVPDYIYYNEKIWPIQNDYVPFDIFEPPTDPIPNIYFKKNSK